MNTSIVLSIICALSIILNVFFIWYVRNILFKLLFVSESLRDVDQMVQNFALHTKTVYELDRFYGDETLEYLLLHAVELLEQLEEFQGIISLTTEEETESGAENEEDISDEDEEAQK